MFPAKLPRFLLEARICAQAKKFFFAKLSVSPFSTFLSKSARVEQGAARAAISIPVFATPCSTLRWKLPRWNKFFFWHRYDSAMQNVMDSFSAPLGLCSKHGPDLQSVPSKRRTDPAPGNTAARDRGRFGNGLHTGVVHIVCLLCLDHTWVQRKIGKLLCWWKREHIIFATNVKCKQFI